MLRAAMDRVHMLNHSASEKFKQSEAADWDDGLYQEALGLLEEAQELFDENALIADELECRIDPSVLEQLTPKPDFHRGDIEQRWHRKDLTTLTVPVSGTIDEILPQSLDDLLAHVPVSWWREQQSRLTEEQRAAVLRPLVLCGRERWGTGYPALHRFASYLTITETHLLQDPLLDIYSGARAIPQICMLGFSLDSLKNVKGPPRKFGNFVGHLAARQMPGFTNC